MQPSKPELNMRHLRKLATKRTTSAANAEAALVEIIDEVRRVRDGGGDINITKVARITGLSRNTIYERLER